MDWPQSRRWPDSKLTEWPRRRPSTDLSTARWPPGPFRVDRSTSSGTCGASHFKWAITSLSAVSEGGSYLDPPDRCGRIFPRRLSLADRKSIPGSTGRPAGSAGQACPPSMDWSLHRHQGRGARATWSLPHRSTGSSTASWLPVPPHDRAGVTKPCSSPVHGGAAGGARVSRTDRLTILDRADVSARAAQA